MPKKTKVKNFNRITVVENNRGLNSLILKSLNREGFQTASAFTGEQALKKIETGNHDILLIDYKLPDMTAKELIQILLEKKLFIPFVIMTGHGSEKIAVEMMKMGASDYITKGSDFIEILIQRLKKLCSEINSQKELEKVKKDLKDTEAFWSSLFNGSTDPILITDLKDNVLDVNPAFEKIGRAHV